MNPKLEVSLAGLKLKNPVMLASGPLGASPSVLKRIARAGAGAVVTKTLTLEPRGGYKPPVIHFSRCYILNAVGLANPGIKNFRNAIQDFKEEYVDVPIVVSLAASNTEEYVQIAGLAQDYGADGVELNLSCPHVKGLGADIADDPALVKEIVSAVKKRVKIPVFAKLTPNTPDIVMQGRPAVEGGADGLVAVNTVRGMAVDINRKTPVLSNVYGGVSGRALHPIAVYSVYALRRALEVPIVGVGGVMTWRDAVELILAGATAVQIYTALLTSRKEPEAVITSLTKGITNYMRKHGFTCIEEMSGYILRQDPRQSKAV